jgi:hypothetical protein
VSLRISSHLICDLPSDGKGWIDGGVVAFGCLVRWVYNRWDKHNISECIYKYVSIFAWELLC